MLRADDRHIESATGVAPTVGEKRAALEEVLQSTPFLRADQLRNFLRYVCEMEITGHASDLCEHLIGIEAFGRPLDYSTAEDSIVRRRAIDLREKLAEVYATELATSQMRIILPKGRYVPRFVRVEPTREPDVFKPEVDPGDTGTTTRRKSISPFWRSTLFFMLGVLVASIFFLIFLSWRPNLFSQQIDPGITYEAEASRNTFSGNAHHEPCEGCSGGARVRSIGKTPDHYLVLNNVTVSADGKYVLSIYYLLNGARSFFISINDSDGIEVPVTGNNWLTPANVPIMVTLKAGNNTIKFYNNTDYGPDLDRITIR